VILKGEIGNLFGLSRFSTNANVKNKKDSFMALTSGPIISSRPGGLGCWIYQLSKHESGLVNSGALHPSWSTPLSFFI
jgi:hypothetical protein